MSEGSVQDSQRSAVSNPVRAPASPWLSGTRLASEYSLAYIAQIISWTAAAGFNLVLPLQLGPTIFGELALAIGLAYLALGFFDQGFNMGAIRLLTGRRDRDRIGSLVGGKFLLTLALGVPLALAAPLLAQLYRVPGGAPLFLFSGILTVMLGQLSLQDSFIVSAAMNRESLIGRAVVAVGLLTLPWAAVAAGGGSPGAALGALMTYSAGTAVFWVGLGYPPISVSWRKQWDAWRAAAAEAGRFLPLFLAAAYFSWGVLVLAGLFLSLEDVANLKVGLGLLTGVAGLVPLPGMMIYSSFLGLAASGGQREVSRYFRVVLLIALTVGGIGALGLGLLGPALVRVVYGSQFEVAATILGVLAPAVVLQSLDQPLVGFLIARDLPVGRLSWLYLGGTVVAVLLTLALTAHFGAKGTALAVLVGRAGILAILLAFIWRTAV